MTGRGIVVLVVALVMILGINTAVLADPGNALKFEGRQDRVIVPNHQSLDFTSLGEMTVELWVKDDSSESTYHLLGKRGGNINYQLAWSLPSLYFGGTVSVGFAYQLPIGQWVHLAGTYKDGEACIYINGNLAICGPAEIGPPNSDDFLIGKSGSYGGFSGEMDEVRIWNVARTESQISSNYNKLVAPFTEGLVGYWRFDETNLDAQTVIDFSGIDNHGTLGLTSAVETSDPVRVVSTAPIDAEFPYPPVVLVHGWGAGSPDTWNEAQAYLETAGFTQIWVADNLNSCGYPGEVDFNLNADSLARFIETRAALVGYPSDGPINIVAHSMGGLISRRLLAYPPPGFDFQVENLIMLGTPNLGSELVNWVCNPSPAWCLAFTPACALYTICSGGSANCELTPKAMEGFHADHPKPGGVSFTGIAGTKNSVDCGFCGIQQCYSDGRVKNASVQTCDPIFLDHYYNRPLGHRDLRRNEEVFTGLVIPILQGNPPPPGSEPVVAAGLPDSSNIQLFYGMFQLSDSTAWMAETLSVETGTFLELTTIALSSGIEMELEDPLGTTIDSAVVEADPVKYSYSNEVGVATYTVDTPDPGDWIVRFRSNEWLDTIAPVLILGFVENEVELIFYDLRPEGEVQNNVVLRARVTEGGTPVLGSSVWITARSDFDTLTWDFPLLDDGNGADSLVDDGIYSGIFTNVTLPGFYGFNCEARDTTYSGNDFTRFAVLQTLIIETARGDIDKNGIFDVFDVVGLIDYVFRNGSPPFPAFLADVNCDSVHDIFDVVTLINHVFRGGPQPQCP